MSLGEILALAGIAGLLALVFSVFWRKPPPKGDWYESHIGESANPDPHGPGQ